ncbi:MAG: DUF3737 family protein [Clostridiales bacterium]|nr:DUF3737 family protein [Clostridiales bacterium]
MQLFTGKTYDEERALYGIDGARVENCTFAGPADGESALKEARNLDMENCLFELRYPLWHVTNGTLKNCRMTETCRAALWYDQGVTILDSDLGGIKALRECDDSVIKNCKIVSPEFGWFCRGVKIADTELTAEYAFLQTKGMELDHFTLHGKYSFQYVENAHITNSVLNTKDAFWHGKNITVENSIVRGEYLGWYSENLTLINCHISGTQPLCYCKGLKLINCTMEATDLSFEKSEVEATVSGHILSVKNPESGFITADTIGEIILDAETPCKITVRQ